MKTISRKDIKVEDYIQIFEKESHHNHEIVEINGVLAWKKNPDIEPFLKNISLNDLCPLLSLLGFGKNSEVYRKLYRDMGYSLSSYWEIFYWNWNNEECENYRAGA